MCFCCFCECFSKILFFLQGEWDFENKKQKTKTWTSLTYKKANLGPVFNFTAYISGRLDARRRCRVHCFARPTSRSATPLLWGWCAGEVAKWIPCCLALANFVNSLFLRAIIGCLVGDRFAQSLGAIGRFQRDCPKGPCIRIFCLFRVVFTFDVAIQGHKDPFWVKRSPRR